MLSNREIQEDGIRFGRLEMKVYHWHTYKDKKQHKQMLGMVRVRDVYEKAISHDHTYTLRNLFHNVLSLRELLFLWAGVATDLIVNDLFTSFRF